MSEYEYKATMPPIPIATHLTLNGKPIGTRQIFKITKTEIAASAVLEVSRERGVAPWSNAIFESVELAAKLTATKTIRITPGKLGKERVFGVIWY
tara:strand:- start:66 stop:350 length:285 start_codon:yes stop_codon:yes gene_type:complete